jgi:hypothetical protein
LYKSVYNIRKILPEKLINIFVFFLAFPAINLFGNSITFYIFLGIIFKVGFFWNKSFSGKSLFFSFLILGLISTIFAPYDAMPRHPGFATTFKMIVQFTYWILIAAFFSLNYQYLNNIKLSKYIFWGLICSTIGFYLFPIKANFGFFDIGLYQTRNSYVFTLLALMPLCFFYIVNTFKGYKLNVYFLFFLLVTLFTNGRSGAIIIIIELIIIAAIIYEKWMKNLKFFLITMLLLFTLLQSNVIQTYLDVVATAVEQVNPRFANLLRSEGDGDLSFDKSWLIRKLMIDKSLEMIPIYPVLGVGVNNFIYYDAELQTLTSYDRLLSETKEFWNSRSAHNSYIQILTEFGMIAFCIFLSILFLPIKKLVLMMNRNYLEIIVLPLISLLGISLHFYAIVSITGALPWFIIGICYASLKKVKKI